MNVLAIDQGTSATKAVVVGPGQEILGAAQVPVATRAAGDAVEADPAELLESVLAAGRQALAAARAPAAAVALANQGETVLAWDRRTGQPLTPAVVWQDRRSAGVCARLAPEAGWLARGHRPAAGPVLRRAQDDLAAREPDRRRRGHHH